MPSLEKYQGCFIGLALGDASCAPFEGGILERFLWKFFSKTKDGKYRYTDDTQMSIDIAQSLIAYKIINQNALAESFASSYVWSRGYGPGAAKLLKGIKKGLDWHVLNTKQFKEGSYGNGAAMRVAPLSLFFTDEKQLLIAVEKSAIITHAHSDAITGAKIIALTISAMLHDKEKLILAKLISFTSALYQEKLILVKQWISTDNVISVKEVKKKLGNGIEAINSTVTAIYIALRHINSDFSEMLLFVQKLKGDTDTIASMAGAIWGAKNGFEAINHPMLNNLESKNKIIELSNNLHSITKLKSIIQN